jgi:hypothetical protein
MNDLKRLLLSDASEQERTLLQAGASEEPPVDGARRLAVALGVASGSSEDPRRAEGDGAGQAPQPSGGSVATHVVRAGATKWLALTTAGLLAVAGTTLFIRSRSKPEQAADGRARVVSQPSSSDVRLEGREQRSRSDEPPTRGGAAARLDQSGTLIAPPAADGEHAMREVGSERTTGDARSLAPPEQAARSIAQEIAQLELVRGLLREGSARAALGELALYDARHPRGALLEEADFMRIEALVGAGQPAAAKRLAERFTRQHAASVHNARVRALLRSLDAR